MTWVKICGLRTTADVKAATDAGADASGSCSPRSRPGRSAPTSPPGSSPTPNFPAFW
jgi:hypothetical protein